VRLTLQEFSADAGDPTILSNEMGFQLYSTIQVAFLALIVSLPHLLLHGCPPTPFCWFHPS
jgi:hypothetical protein